jgi:hypothetical protein
MADIKIHSAASNAISPNPAMMNSDHLFVNLASNIFSTFKPCGYQQATKFVDVI